MEKDRDTPERKILECIDSGLDSFGAPVRIVLYWRMQKEFGLTREDITLKPDTFARAIESMFGIGTQRVEQILMNEMRRRLGLEHLASKDLVGAISEVRNLLSHEESGMRSS